MGTSGFEIPAELLDTRLTVYPQIGRSANDALFGEAYFEMAYVEATNENVLDNKGKRVVSNLFAIFGPSCRIEDEDNIAWNGVRYEVVNRSPLSMGGSIAQVEVRFRSVRR